MSRDPIFDRAMTSSERQRRFLDKLVRNARAAALVEPSLFDRLQHDPAEAARWLRDHLGHATAQALCDALTSTLQMSD
jgi:hypothetical protein